MSIIRILSEIYGLAMGIKFQMVLPVILVALMASSCGIGTAAHQAASSIATNAKDGGLAIADAAKTGGKAVKNTSVGAVDSVRMVAQARQRSNLMRPKFGLVG